MQIVSKQRYSINQLTNINWQKRWHFQRFGFLIVSLVCSKSCMCKLRDSETSRVRVVFSYHVCQLLWNLEMSMFVCFEACCVWNANHYKMEAEIIFGSSFVHSSNSYGSEETFRAKISHQAS